MTEFERPFAPLLAWLPNAHAESHGAPMLGVFATFDRLATPNLAEAAQSCHKITVLKAKRHERDALDYAEKFLEVDAIAETLDVDRLYWVHRACPQNDVCYNYGDLRHANHTNAALQLMNNIAERNVKNACIEQASKDFEKHLDAEGKPIPQKEKTTP